MGYNLGDFPERLNRSKTKKEKTESKMNAFALTGFDNFIEIEKSNEIFDTRGLFDKTDFTDRVAYNVVDVPIEYLRSDQNNSFRPLIGEKREELKQSIAEHGIQTPLMVRRKGSKYEIVCGNNRKSIAEELGMETLPCIIKEVDDYEASILAGIDNINRREEISDIEKGWAYRKSYEALVRNKNENLKRGDSPMYHAETSGNEDTKVLVAKAFSVSSATLHRKMRLTYLIDELLRFFEARKISQEVAIELSYLTSLQQIQAIEEIEKYKKISLDCAKDLHKRVEENPGMGINEIEAIFVQYRTIEKERKQKPKLGKYCVPDNLFPSFVSTTKNREEYIASLLKNELEKQ